MGYLYSFFYAIPWLGAVISVLVLAFQVWMIVDCIRSGNDIYWIFIIFFFSFVGALVYFFLCKYGTSGVDRSFSKRRAQKRQIEELQSKIHHLDKSHHYAELGDVYRAQKKWAQAQQAYGSALDRDKDLFDARVHLGYVLLAQGRAAEAWNYLGPAVQKQPSFESGELLWQCARCQAALGHLTEARQLYEKFLVSHGYLQAQLEYSEVLDKLGESAASAEALKQIIHDFEHAPRFLKRTNHQWKRKAQRLLLARGVKP